MDCFAEFDMNTKNTVFDIFLDLVKSPHPETRHHAFVGLARLTNDDLHGM